MTWHPKWLLPPSLLACLVLLNPSWADDLLPTAAAVAAFSLALGRLGNRPLENIMICMILGIFLTGFVQLQVAERLTDDMKELLFGYPSSFYADDRDVRRDAYWIAVVAFGSFCGTVALPSRPGFEGNPCGLPRQIDPSQARGVLTFAWCCLVILLVLTGLVQWSTGIGVLGQGGVLSFYGGAGAVNYSRLFVIPYLLLVGYAVAKQVGNSRLSTLFLATIVLHGVTQSFVTASRGALAHAVLPVAIWIVLSGRFTRKSLVVCILLLMTISFLHPIITDVREGQMLDGRRGASAALRDATQSMNVTANITDGLVNVAFRVQFAQGLLAAAHEGDVPLNFSRVAGMLLHPTRQFSEIYTADILVHPNAATGHRSAPGLVGAFYIVAGYPAVIAGMIALAATARLWERPWHERYVTGVAMKAYLAYFVLQIWEGDIDMIPRYALIVAFSFIAGELLARQATSGRPQVAGLPAPWALHPRDRNRTPSRIRAHPKGAPT